MKESSSPNFSGLESLLSTSPYRREFSQGDKKNDHVGSRHGVKNLGSWEESCPQIERR